VLAPWLILLLAVSLLPYPLRRPKQTLTQTLARVCPAPLHPPLAAPVLLPPHPHLPRLPQRSRTALHRLLGPIAPHPDSPNLPRTRCVERLDRT
jgi:hypothetical protein